MAYKIKKQRAFGKISPIFKISKKETIYENISYQELKEIAKNKSYHIVLVPVYDGWRYALYKGDYRTSVQKRAGQYDITY